MQFYSERQRTKSRLETTTATEGIELDNRTGLQDVISGDEKGETDGHSSMPDDPNANIEDSKTKAEQ